MLNQHIRLFHFLSIHTMGMETQVFKNQYIHPGKNDCLTRFDCFQNLICKSVFIASYAVIFTLMMILFPVWIDDRSKNIFVYIWWCFQLGERSRNDCAYRIFVAPWLVVITTAQLHSTKSLLNSGSAQVQILLAVCQRFVIVWISYNGPSWRDKVKCLSSVIHTTKTINRHHHHHGMCIKSIPYILLQNRCLSFLVFAIKQNTQWKRTSMKQIIKKNPVFNK